MEKNHLDFDDNFLFEHVMEGIIVTDEKEIVVKVNAHAEALLGRKKETCVGKPISKVIALENEYGKKIPSQWQPTHLALLIKEPVNTGIPDIETVYYYRRKNNIKFPVSIVAAPIVHDGKIFGVANIFWDISHDLYAYNAKKELFALATHHLRAPLGVVRWNLDLLLGSKKKSVSPEVAKVLREMNDHVTGLIKLINDILKATEIEEKKGADGLSPTNAVELIGEVVQEMQAFAKTKKVVLSFVAPKKIPSVAVEPTLFKNVMAGLITNALQYNTPDGSVSISLKKGDLGVTIAVKDTGIGIPLKSQGRVFTKFYRAENALKFNHWGSGLELYMAKLHVEAWEGRIWFESKEGKGSTFFVFLPFPNAEMEDYA